jgi:mono/diheme cytochrome c family protein
MRAWKLRLLLFIALLVAVGLYGASVIRRGFSVHQPPSALEAAVARTVRSMSIPTSARQEVNPWKDTATPEVIAGGRAHWADHCATCHANDGSGQTPIGQNLYPPAPDMRLPATQNLTDGELYYIIQNGVRLTGMPGWGQPGETRSDESWHLVLFIRHLPSLTSEELEEMKGLNPKTEADRAEEQQEEEFLKGGELSPKSAEEPHHH